jgi:uncharacterized protein (TIGR00290 family)
MHGVREELLEQQAAALDISLQKLILDDQPAMDEYETRMMDMIKQLKEEDFTHAIFGDIFLEDLKAYRETQLGKQQMQSIFPIWKKDTKDLMHEFISLGFKAIVVCINTSFLDKSFCGRLIDETFVNNLPNGVDPCGENGEYHSFVFDGPIFKSPVQFAKGETVYKEYKTPVDKNKDCFTKPQPQTGFYFIDLLPCDTV